MSAMIHRPSAFLWRRYCRSGRACGLALGAELRGVFTDYSLTTWGQAEGLPANTIWAIAQTEEGYLWLGTDAGPVRFDGVRFVPWEALGLPPLPAPPFARWPPPGTGVSGSGSAVRAAWSVCRRTRYGTTAPARGWRKAPSRCCSSIPTARCGWETSADCTAWSPIAGNGSKMACRRPCPHGLCRQEPGTFSSARRWERTVEIRARNGSSRRAPFPRPFRASARTARAHSG